jgi:hypothetical protein
MWLISPNLKLSEIAGASHLSVCCPYLVPCSSWGPLARVAGQTNFHMSQAVCLFHSCFLSAQEQGVTVPLLICSDHPFQADRADHPSKKLLRKKCTKEPQHQQEPAPNVCSKLEQRGFSSHLGWGSSTTENTAARPAGDVHPGRLSPQSCLAARKSCYRWVSSRRSYGHSGTTAGYLIPTLKC